MTWQFTDDRPIYLQLMEQIQLKIICGQYKVGEKLPSVRDLASEAALSELERIGLVFSQRTSGRFITEDSNMVENMRKDLAREQIEKFLNNMEKIGFGRKEAIALMENIAKEMK